MEKDEPTFGWIGGPLCLDFTNTVSNHRGLKPREKLNTFEDLVNWCHRAGILDDTPRQEMLRQGSRVPAPGERLLLLAQDFWEDPFGPSFATNQGSQPPQGSLE